MIESCENIYLAWESTPTGFQSSESSKCSRGTHGFSAKLLYHISFSSAPAGVTHAPVPYNFKLWGKRVAYDIMTSGSVTLQPLNSSPGQNKSISEKLACDIILIWSYMILLKNLHDPISSKDLFWRSRTTKSRFRLQVLGENVSVVSPSLAELLAQKLEAFYALTLCLAWHLRTAKDSEKLLPKLTN